MVHSKGKEISLASHNFVRQLVATAKSHSSLPRKVQHSVKSTTYCFCMDAVRFRDADSQLAVSTVFMQKPRKAFPYSNYIFSLKIKDLCGATIMCYPQKVKQMRFF